MQKHEQICMAFEEKEPTSDTEDLCSSARRSDSYRISACLLFGTNNVYKIVSGSFQQSSTVLHSLTSKRKKKKPDIQLGFEKRGKKKHVHPRTNMVFLRPWRVSPHHLLSPRSSFRILLYHRPWSTSSSSSTSSSTSKSSSDGYISNNTFNARTMLIL